MSKELNATPAESKSNFKVIQGYMSNSKVIFSNLQVSTYYMKHCIYFCDDVDKIRYYKDKKIILVPQCLLSSKNKYVIIKQVIIREEGMD